MRIIFSCYWCFWVNNEDFIICQTIELIDKQINIVFNILRVSCCYWCRYYHFRDFLDDYGSVGLPDDVSPQMKTELSDYEMGQGYFMLSDLSNFCEQQEKDLLVRLFQSRDYQITKQLNRIERFLKQESTTKDESDGIGYEGMGIKEIYEDFQDEYWYYQSLHLSVRGFLRGAKASVNDKDVRVLYGVW